MKCTLAILQESDCFYKNDLGEHSFYYELETENGKLMIHYDANVNLDALKDEMKRHGCIKF